MSKHLDEQQQTFRSVRWSLVLAFVRTTTAALVVFTGLAWGGFALYNEFAQEPLLPPDWVFSQLQWEVIVLVLIGSAVLAVLLTVGTGGLREARTLNRRFKILIEAAMLWASGRLGHRIIVQGEGDELSELAHSLNGMAARLEEQVAALQRLVEENELLYQQAAGAAALEERTRLARDLHDSVSQQLFALGMTAGAANKLMAQDPERARPFVTQIEEMAAKAQAEMRALLLHLRPVELDGRSLEEALERFLHDVCPRHSIRYDLEYDVTGRLGEGIEAHLFRIAQEAVSNVIRHASAGKVLLRFSQRRDIVLMTIQDDGKGFEKTAVRDGSYGMHSIRERTEEIGGHLEVRTGQGQGTELRVTVSMRGQGEEAASDEDSDSLGG